MQYKPLWDKEGLGADDFEIAYKLYSQRIYWFLYWRTKDSMVSEDLTTGAFEKAWQSRKNFHGGSLQAWLYRIARNMLIDYWRKKKDILVEDTDEVAEPTQDSSAALDKELLLQELQTAIHELPVTMRLVIELRFMEGLSTKQVAERLQMSESNVRVTQYRALQQLRKNL
jgi:RNA polymerase sigma-70 factor (ECF subfamily)